MREYEKKKIVNFLAEVDIKFNRGIGLFSSVKNSIYVGTALKLMFDLTIAGAIFASICCLAGFYFIGYIDLKYIRLYQREAELGSSKYNPFLNRIRKIK